jgi:hypothetical protein
MLNTNLHTGIPKRKYKKAELGCCKNEARKQ